MQILPPASCTAWVTILCFSASSGVLSLAAPEYTPPSSFGPMPPVTIRPTPPRARSAKYAAMRSKPCGFSSRPVCMDPIRVRLRRVVKPRSNGASRCG